MILYIFFNIFDENTTDGNILLLSKRLKTANKIVCLSFNLKYVYIKYNLFSKLIIAYVQLHRKQHY